MTQPIKKSEWFSGVDTMAAKLRETQRRQGKNLVAPTPCSKMKVESHLEKLMEQFQSPSCQEPGECSFVYF